MKILPDGINFDFVGKRRFFAALSMVVCLVSLALFFTVGPKWGIDFTGGTQIRLDFDESVGIGDLRKSLEPLGLSGDSVQQFGVSEHSEYIIRVQDPGFGFTALKEEMNKALVGRFGEGWIKDVRADEQTGARLAVTYGGEPVGYEELGTVLSAVPGVSVERAPDDNTFYVKLPPQTEQISRTMESYLVGKTYKVVEVQSVGPAVGSDMRRKAAISIAMTMVLIFLYVAFRFELSYAPGAFLSLLHDACVILGAYVVFRMDFNLNAIGVILTVLGYSINDTIVIYDRIRENQQVYRRMDLPKLINDTVNQMLGRTIATSVTTLLGILAFLFWGGPTIRDFAVALIVGICTGAYSTVYVASSLILVMQDYKPHIDRILSTGKRSSPEDAAEKGRGINKFAAVQAEIPTEEP